jgi:prevent-host-death family protein
MTMRSGQSLVMRKKTVAISELKAHCLRLLDEVARHGESLVVTKRGRPIARVVPIGPPAPDEALARLRGTLAGGDTLADFEIGLAWESARR